MKRAILVGINYIGTSSELRGCLNDVDTMKNLATALEFDEIQTITEQQATTNNIGLAFMQAIRDARPGDVVLLCVSCVWHLSAKNGYEASVVVSEHFITPWCSPHVA